MDCFHGTISFDGFAGNKQNSYVKITKSYKVIADIELSTQLKG